MAVFNTSGILHILRLVVSGLPTQHSLSLFLLLWHTHTHHCIQDAWKNGSFIYSCVHVCVCVRRKLYSNKARLSNYHQGLHLKVSFYWCKLEHNVCFTKVNFWSFILVTVTQHARKSKTEQSTKIHFHVSFYGQTNLCFPACF